MCWELSFACALCACALSLCIPCVLYVCVSCVCFMYVFHVCVACLMPGVHVCCFDTLATDSVAEDGLGLHEYFPSFTWIVRDFTLQLEENGKRITSRQYLETALNQQGTR